MLADTGVRAFDDEKTRRWEVSAYIWQPSQIIVNEGDEVTLEFVGINGSPSDHDCGIRPDFHSEAGRPIV